MKEKATISANQEKQVAETNAARDLAVAQLEKEKAETLAAQKLEVAKLDRQASEEQASQILILAKAEKEKISLAGAITETERLTLQTKQETAIGVAQALAQVKVPQVIISGKDGGATGGGNQADLINLFLLKQNGLLDAMKSPTMDKQ